MHIYVEPARAADRETYDQGVEHSVKPHFMQLWGWGEVKRDTGWLPHRFVARDGQGRVVGALTVLERRLPGLGAFMYAPTGPAAAYAGPAAAAAALLTEAGRLARRRGAMLLRVDPDLPVDDAAAVTVLRQLGFRPGTAAQAFEALQPRFVMRLELEGDEDAVFARFHAKTRYNIRYAQRQGVTTRVADRPEDLEHFYGLLRMTAARQRFAVRAPSYFRSLWRHLVEPGHGRLFLAEKDGRPLAGILVFRCGDTVWYLYGGTDYGARQLMPSHAAQWAAIRWALEEGCRVYDFRGVSGRVDPSDPHYGLYRFKRGFGAELVELLGEYDRVYSPLRYHAFRLAFAARRALRRLRGGGSAAASEADQGG